LAKAAEERGAGRSRGEEEERKEEVEEEVLAKEDRRAGRG
jgi:hypothetical protein